jgi:hypothetical protein
MSDPERMLLQEVASKLDELADDMQGSKVPDMRACAQKLRDVARSTPINGRRPALPDNYRRQTNLQVQGNAARVEQDALMKQRGTGRLPTKPQVQDPRRRRT